MNSDQKVVNTELSLSAADSVLRLIDFRITRFEAVRRWSNTMPGPAMMFPANGSACLRVWGSGFRVWVLDSRFWVLGPKFGVWVLVFFGLWFMVSGLGFRVQGQGVGSRIFRV